MNFKNESAFTRWYCKRLAAAGAETVAIVGSRMQQAGVCDRYVAHPTFRGWLESKRADARARLHQKLFMRRMVAKGDVAMVVRYHASETMEIEDCDGHQLGWLNLRPLYALSDADAGKRLLWALAEAWETHRGGCLERRAR